MKHLEQQMRSQLASAGSTVRALYGHGIAPGHTAAALYCEALRNSAEKAVQAAAAQKSNPAKKPSTPSTIKHKVAQ